MVKAEWNTKRTCPKCGTRFYDLTKDDPVTCIECGEEWDPEPVLKSKQPIPFEDEKKKDIEADADLGGEDEDDLDLDIDEICADLGISASNCYVTLHRARHQLRGCLERNWFEQGDARC